jgi:hypothetical protein
VLHGFASEDLSSAREHVNKEGKTEACEKSFFFSAIPPVTPFLRVERFFLPALTNRGGSKRLVAEEQHESGVFPHPLEAVPLNKPIYEMGSSN